MHKFPPDVRITPPPVLTCTHFTMSHYCSVMIQRLLHLEVQVPTPALDCPRQNHPPGSLVRFLPPPLPPVCCFHPSPYQWDTDEVNTFNSTAIPPPPASLWSTFWMAGSNFLIHLSGGWLTGSALAKLMSRVHSGMHYSSSKHYFGGVYAPSHVNAPRRSSRSGGGGVTPPNRWTSGGFVFFLHQHSMKMPNGGFRCDLRASETAKAAPRFTWRGLLLGNTRACGDFLGTFVSRRSVESAD